MQSVKPIFDARDLIGQAGLRSGRTVITRREIAGAANQVHVMLIQPLTYYEEPLTRCLNTIVASRQEKIYIESTQGCSYCNQWPGFGKASNLIVLIQFSKRNASMDGYVRLQVSFLFSALFSIFLLTLFPWSVDIMK